MARGEIIVNESFCKGCGYCAHFCSPGCIVMSNDKVTTLGLPIPVFTEEEKCTGCGVCAWMCPCFAIEVYERVEIK